MSDPQAFGFVTLVFFAAIGVLSVITAAAVLGLVFQHHREERRGRQ